MQYAHSILETIGNTPLIKLNKITSEIETLVLAKVESFNPGNSVKDRMALKMVEDAEAVGLLKPGGIIVEGTSGNTGMGLALAAIVKGYKLICVSTDKQSKEKFDVLRAVGAEVIVCPTDVAPEDPRSYYSTSKRIADETPNAWYANQYDNPSNAKAHYETTGPEIWEQTQGKITHFVVGVGTGGTISGVGKFLKEKNSEDIAIHHMPLLANSRLKENQDVMCDTMSAAAEESGVSFSLMPVSIFAVILRLLGFHKPKLSGNLAKTKTKQMVGFTQKQRLKYASDVITKADSNEVIVFGCASNQNRAGTLYLAVNSFFTRIKGLFAKTKKAANHFVATGHELFTASLTAPGSMGMKKESCVSGLFGGCCDKHLYGGASASRTKAELPPYAKERLCGLQEKEKKVEQARLSDLFSTQHKKADKHESHIRSILSF